MADTGYQVLARKWRPQLFAELAGLEHIARTLQNAIRRERVGHAFLFTGSRGVGKTSAARILAKALNCVAGPAPEPCNHCENCLAVTAGTSPDVIEIDGASNRGIGEIRLLRESVSYLPQTSLYKIYIIDEVHMLTSEAFNALLKTLEEPPDHVKFIMATTDVHKVPMTILSRCQRFDFGRLSSATISSALVGLAEREGIEFGPGSVELLAREARGSMRDALSLLDQARSYAGERITLEDLRAALGLIEARHCLGLLQAVVGGRLDEAVRSVDQLEQSGIDLKVFAEEFLFFLRDALFLKLSPSGLGKLVGLSREDAEALKPLLEVRALPYWQQLFTLWQEHYGRVRTAQLPRLALEAALVELGLVCDLEPVDELLGRLEGFLSAPAASAGQGGTAEAGPGSARAGGAADSRRPQAVTKSSRDGILPPAPPPEAVPASEPPPPPEQHYDTAVGNGRKVSPAAVETATRPVSEPVAKRNFPESGKGEGLSGKSMPAPGSQAAALVEERWPAFLEYLNSRDRRLGSMLQRSRPRVAGRELTLEVMPYTLETLGSDESRKYILEHLDRFLGEKSGLLLKLKAGSGSGGGGSAASRGKTRSRAPGQRRTLPGKEEIFRDEAVRFINDRFGGRVEEIRPRR